MKGGPYQWVALRTTRRRILALAVRVVRKAIDEGLEHDIRRTAGQASFAYHARLLPRKAEREQVHLAGEVDPLAADLGRRRICVIEAKHQLASEGGPARQPTTSDGNNPPFDTFTTPD